MNVRYTLKILADKVESIYPKMPNVKNPNDYKETVKRSVISDIQQNFAEIYAIINREIADDSLDLEYNEALNKFPERIQSILNLISVLALCTKTKLNINKTENIFDDQFVKNINAVCRECYKIELTLSEKLNSSANETFEKGLINSLKYSDYKTGFERSVRPGGIKGQIQGLFICTPEQYQPYISLRTQTREDLDQGYKIANINSRCPILFQSHPETPIKLVETKQPKSLFQLSTHVAITNKNTLFKKLASLPRSVADKIPELDVDYKRKFVNKVKKVIEQINFKPSQSENKYLDLILQALEKANPYNEMHSVLNKLDQVNKTAFFSTFKENMQPIRNAIVKLMKEYNKDKQEYIAHFENPIPQGSNRN